MRIAHWGWTLSLLAFYGLLTSLGPADSFGDTSPYVGQLEGFIAGQPQPLLWEFGHMIWRPYALGCWHLFGALLARWQGDTTTEALARVMIVTNWLAGALVVLGLFRLFRRRVETPAAALASAAICCCYSFWNYSQTGAPYVAGLAALVWSLDRAYAASLRPGGGKADAFVSGLLHALASLLWFPYALVGCGWLYLLWRAECRNWRDKAGLWVPYLGALCGLFIPVCLFAAFASGVKHPGAVLAWMEMAGHGMTPNQRYLRFLTGWPRGLIHLLNDPVELKRFLRHDPYQQISMTSIIFCLGPKFVLCYVWIATILWGLWRSDRRLLAALGLAVVPMIFFSIAVFEPSSPERFLPVYPLIFLGCAVIFDQALRGSLLWPGRILAVAFLLLMIWNGRILRDINRDVASTMARTQAFEAALEGRRALVMTLILQDPFLITPNQRFLDRQWSRHPNYRINPALSLLSATSQNWRSNCARRMLEAWDLGEEVWITRRLFEERPKPEWLWVEGEDPNVRWSELYQFFNSLHRDRSTTGSDGFERITRNSSNQRLLAGAQP